MSKTLLILGAGGFGREVLWAARAEGHYNLGGFLDDDPLKHGKLLCHVPVLGGLDRLKEMDLTKVEIIFGIGPPSTKRKLLAKISNGVGVSFAVIEHPSVQRSSYVKIGEGTVLTAGCILTTQVTIGRHVNLNLDCTVGHDTTIGDFSNISPGVHISGRVDIEEGVDIGTGANILPGVRIGKWSVIGAGAVVTKDIPPYTVSVGIPAKVIKEFPHP